MFKRYVASKRHTMQVDFDDYMAALGEGAQGGRGAAHAAPGAALPVRAARRVIAARRRGDAAVGRREAHQGRQPRRDPRRGPRRLRRARLRRGRRARHRAPHRARRGHVLQLLPRQGVGVPRARARGRRRGAAARARRAPAARDAARVRRGRLPRVLLLHRRGRRARRVPRRATPGTIRAMFEESRGARRASTSWPSDLRAAIAAGLLPALDVELCARGDGRGGARARRSGWQRDPPDVDGATRFATRCSSAAWSLLLALLSCRRRRSTLRSSSCAALHVGIAENKPNLFSDPLFSPLGAKQARVVVSYDVMTSGDDELQRVTEYSSPRGRRAIEPLVTFEHARGARRDLREAQEPAQAPVPAAYGEAATSASSRRSASASRSCSTYVAVERDQPLHAADLRATRRRRRSSPGSCARTASAARSSSPTCSTRPTIRAPRSRRYRRTLAYIKKFRRALKTPRTICGLHNYSDINRFRDTGTKKIIKALGCKQIWLTETGGIYKFAGFRHQRTPPAEGDAVHVQARASATSGSSASTSTRGSGARPRASTPGWSRTAVRGWPTGRSRSTCRSRRLLHRLRETTEIRWPEASHRRE